MNGAEMLIPILVPLGFFAMIFGLVYMKSRENLAMIDHGRSLGADSLVRGLMCIHTTFTCPPDFITRAYGLAVDRDVAFHAHVNEGTHEGLLCQEHYGMRTLALYDSLGVAGSRLLASQCVQIDVQIAVLAEEDHVVTGAIGVHVTPDTAVGEDLEEGRDLAADGLQVAFIKRHPLRHHSAGLQVLLAEFEILF